MARFPFFREIAGERVLVVGGGEVALRRARALAEFGADVHAVAPEFCAGFDDIGRLHRRFEAADLEGAAVVIAATDDRSLNAWIARKCRERGIEVNVSDDPSACTFQFPALVKRGLLTVGISTDGASPVASKYVRGQIEKVVPERFEEILECMDGARRMAKALVADRTVRTSALEKVFRNCLQADVMPDVQEMEYMIRRYSSTEMD